MYNNNDDFYSDVLLDMYVTTAYVYGVRYFSSVLVNKVSYKKQHNDFPGEVSTPCSAVVGLYFAAVRVCHITARPDFITSEDGVVDFIGVNQLSIGVVEQVVDAAAQVAPEVLQCCATLCSAGAIAGAVRVGEICQLNNEVAF